MELSEASWRTQAACLSHDPELFFAGGESGPTQAALQRARAVCSGCPVRMDCLEYALETGPRYGIWGGMTQDEIRALRRRRKLRPAS